MKTTNPKLTVTYDKAADAMYIYLDSDCKSVDYTYLCDPRSAPDGVAGMINLDFNEGKFKGIEIMDASKKFDKATFKSLTADGATDRGFEG